MRLIPLVNGIDVLVRGWLNANQVIGWQAGCGGSGVVVDSGYWTHADATVAALRRHAAHSVGFSRLINTHCHSDHMGGNAALRDAFDVAIVVPIGEARHIEPWDPQHLWLDHTGQGATPFAMNATLAAGDTFEFGGRDWHAIAAPGHAMEALMYWEPQSRLLITGDALWENGTGFVWPTHGDNPYVTAALAALDTIATLDPQVIIPGHGEPFTDVQAALTRARGKLLAFGSDPAKAARYAAKAFFVFNLLESPGIQVEVARQRFAALPVYRTLCEDFLTCSPEAFFIPMLEGLCESGAVRVESHALFPLMPA
jgi:glyoxylase-like metal-dependent hydrolase (beta-lactamase superfamily II)